MVIGLKLLAAASVGKAGQLCSELPCSPLGQPRRSCWFRTEFAAEILDGNESRLAADIIAAIVEIALPSSRLLMNTNVLRFGPAALPSAVSALPAAHASGFCSLIWS